MISATSATGRSVDDVERDRETELGVHPVELRVETASGFFEQQLLSGLEALDCVSAPISTSRGRFFLRKLIAMWAVQRSIHVDSDDSPRKLGSDLKTSMKTSWIRSSIERFDPRMRNSVACTRRDSRRNNSRWAARSPAMHRSTRVRSSRARTRLSGGSDRSWTITGCYVVRAKKRLPTFFTLAAIHAVAAELQTVATEPYRSTLSQSHLARL